MSTYLLSNSINVFPQANRSVQETASLLTEEAIAGIVEHVTDNDSYVVDFDTSASHDWIKFILAGRYFEASSLQTQLSGFTGSGKYLIARTNISEVGSKHIANADVTVGSASQYQGVSFEVTTTNPNWENNRHVENYENQPDSGKTYGLVLTVSGQVPDISKVKIKITSIDSIDCGTL